MYPLFFMVLCAVASADRRHVVVNNFYIKTPATFQDSVSVAGSTSLQDVAMNGTLDMQNHAIVNMAPVPPVLVNTSATVPMNTGATLFVFDTSAADINVTFTDMLLYTEYHVIIDALSSHTVLLDFTTDTFSMNQSCSYWVLMKLTVGITVLNDPCLVPSLHQSERVRLPDPVAGLTGYPKRLAMSGDGQTIVTTSTFDNNMFGIAFVFTRTGNTWSYVQNLTSSDGAQFDEFGASVAVNKDGTTIMVGATSVNGYRGAAYIFTLAGTWSQQARLDPVGAPVFLAFGAVGALSDSGDEAVVGISDTSSTGSAYIFTRSGSTWTLVANLTAEGDAKTADAFGITVDISGSGQTVIIGSPDMNVGSPNKTVYVFVDSGGWTRQQKIDPPPSLVSGSAFGGAVRLSSDGDTAGITSLGTDGTQAGAYMFTRTGGVWTYASRLPTANVAPGDIMGNNLMLSAGAATVVMASRMNAGPPAPGHGHVYGRSGSTWAYVRTIDLDPSENTWMFADQGEVSDDGSTTALMTEDLLDPGWIYVFMTT